MGIIILPNLLEKIESGDADLIPMFNFLSEQKDLTDAAQCHAWWEANKQRYAAILDYPK